MARTALPPREEREPAPRLTDQFVGTGTYERLESAGQMGALGLRVISLAVRPPFTWWREAVLQASIAVRRSIVPLTLSHMAFLFGFLIILFGEILSIIGVSEREATATFLFWSREIGTWITSMIFAGIVGAAITADLGARRIREELDALAVLGVDQVRSLVVPRVIACTVMTPVLVLVSITMVNAVNYIAYPPMVGPSPGVVKDVVAQAVLPLDLLFPVLVKNLLIGFVMGVVACHKGLTCKLGTEGVGRAVNQTVLISFFACWMINSFFNLTYLSLYPDAAAVRG
ncbi:MlaE family ABC transporter permease [Patulibacter minatonensis]|uniref:MlaE family ABC transporter permease n=1 Tax=Patulibacter minatonensis TaxID=298163 RepID=UPI0004BBA6A6|nr:ABC transporter permease [Patulibacter minatonensis]